MIISKIAIDSATCSFLPFPNTARLSPSPTLLCATASEKIEHINLSNLPYKSLCKYLSISSRNLFHNPDILELAETSFFMAGQKEEGSWLIVVGCPACPIPNKIPYKPSRESSFNSLPSVIRLIKPATAKAARVFLCPGLRLAVRLQKFITSCLRASFAASLALGGVFTLNTCSMREAANKAKTRNPQVGLPAAGLPALLEIRSLFPTGETEAAAFNGDAAVSTTASATITVPSLIRIRSSPSETYTAGFKTKIITGCFLNPSINCVSHFSFSSLLDDSSKRWNSNSIFSWIFFLNDEGIVVASFLASIFTFHFPRSVFSILTVVFSSLAREPSLGILKSYLLPNNSSQDSI